MFVDCCDLHDFVILPLIPIGKFDDEIDQPASQHYVQEVSSDHWQRISSRNHHNVNHRKLHHCNTISPAEADRSEGSHNIRHRASGTRRRVVFHAVWPCWNPCRNPSGTVPLSEDLTEVKERDEISLSRGCLADFLYFYLMNGRAVPNEIPLFPNER